jgi:NADH:ubiquinone oxidoreductase subunit
MTIVTEYDWQSDTFTHHTDTHARQAWRAAVTEIAERAKQTLPEANGRVDKAVALVLAGDVELLDGGKARVASQSNGTTQYVVCNGTCECKDFPKAPSGWCKHRIAAGMQKRALALVQKKLAGTNGQAEPAQPETLTAHLPEAPVSITLKATLHGHEVLVTLRGTDFASVKAQVEQASQWLTSQAPAQPATQGTAQPEGWCARHGVQMKLNHGKDGRQWYSHKTAEGWCKGR